MKKIRFLLVPFSFIYWIITTIRNVLFDAGIFKTYIIPVKSICVGNLSVGGTGKSPLVSFLVSSLKEEFKIDVLSRGYGRKTKGYVYLNENSLPNEVGDEPLMYYKKFGKAIGVSVCESRKVGVETILKNSSPDVILLDDAYQHRKVKAGFSILVTDFSKPFFKDYLMPVGNLREARKGVNRADIVIVSKSPEVVPQDVKNYYYKQLNISAENVYFSSISYTELKPFLPVYKVDLTEVKKVLVVTAIANPKLLIDELSNKYEIETLRYPDHYAFSLKDLESIYKKFDNFAADIIITTEKDYVKFLEPEFKDLLNLKPWFYQEISLKFDREKEFITKIKNYVGTI